MSRKLALLIGNSTYGPGLPPLEKPDADIAALAKVLADPAIGAFDEVKPLLDATSATARREVARFFSGRSPDDLLLLYFSGHGLRSDRGGLYLAVQDTEADLLAATAVPAAFISEEMDNCRSRRQILILDCCYSGAFERGAKGSAANPVTDFKGNGLGRFVLTASDSTQLAWEDVAANSKGGLSVFTHHLVAGLKSGEADLNGDGYVSVDELYDYVYARVVEENPRQTPGKSTSKQQGEIFLARNPAGPKLRPLPAELMQDLEHQWAAVREVAVRELERFLRGSDPGLVKAAREALEKALDDDSRKVVKTATEILATIGPAPADAARPPKTVAGPQKDSPSASGKAGEHALADGSRKERASVPEIPKPVVPVKTEPVSPPRPAPESQPAVPDPLNDKGSPPSATPVFAAREASKPREVIGPSLEVDAEANARFLAAAFPASSEPQPLPTPALQPASASGSSEGRLAQLASPPSIVFGSHLHTSPKKESRGMLWIALGVLALLLMVGFLVSRSRKEEEEPVEETPAVSIDTSAGSTETTAASAETPVPLDPEQALLAEAKSWPLVLAENFDSAEASIFQPTTLNLDNKFGIRTGRISSGNFRLSFTARTREGVFNYIAPSPVTTVTDFYLRVDLRKSQGPESADAGLMFRANADQHYAFLIGQEGYYVGIYKDSWRDLRPWTPSAAIRPGQTNSLTVVAIGTSLTLFINDQKVDQVSDATFLSGQVGLGTTSHGVEPVTFDFDNFELRRRPEPQPANTPSKGKDH